MITNTDIGNRWSGQNLGNQLFQIASLYGLSKRYGTRLLIPPGWKHLNSFRLLPDVEVSDREATFEITERNFDYDIDFFDTYKTQFQKEVVNIKGVLQTERYWKFCENEVRELLSFNAEISGKIHEEQKTWISPDTVAISVRRGDFITNPNHYLLPFEYYKDALDQFFPGKPVVVFSDDFKWCKRMFSGLANEVHYSESYSAIEQLCFMGMFKKFIISNSTFSWWGAYLGEPEGKTVIRPHYVFDGPLLETHDVKDHYPDEWIEFKHQEVGRNPVIQFLFYNDNEYRVKKWIRDTSRDIYNNLPLAGKIKAMLKK